MPYELAHDTIALQVFDKASTEARTRRKVERYVRERYQAWQERGAQLTQDDVDFVNPYLNQINITAEESTFVENGKSALRRARRIRRFLVVLAIAVLTTFSIVSFGLWQNAEQQKQVADQRTAEAQRSDSLAQLRAIQALRSDSLAQLRAKEATMAQRADSLKAIELGLALTDANLMRLAAEREANAAKALSLGNQSRMLPYDQLPLAVRLAEAGYYQTSPLPPALAVTQNLAAAFYEQFGLPGEPNYYLPDIIVEPTDDKIVDLYFSENGQEIIILTAAGEVEKWSTEGKFIATIPLPEPAFQLLPGTTPMMVATQSVGGPIYLRNLDGETLVELAVQAAQKPKLVQEYEDNNGQGRYVWQLEGQIVETELAEGPPTISLSWQVSLSPDGKWILTHHSGGYHLWSNQGDLQSFYPENEVIDGQLRKYTGFHFSPDSKYVVAISGWESATVASELLHIAEGRRLYFGTEFGDFGRIITSENPCLFVLNEDAADYLVVSTWGEYGGTQAYDLSDGVWLGYVASHSEDFGENILTNHPVENHFFMEEFGLVCQTDEVETYWTLAPNRVRLEAKANNILKSIPLLSTDFDPTAAFSYVRKATGVFLYQKDRSLQDVFLFAKPVSNSNYQVYHNKAQSIVAALEDNGRLTIWNQQVSIIKSIVTSDLGIVRAAYSNQGQYIVSIDEAGRVHLYSSTGQLLTTLDHKHTSVGNVAGVHWSPDDEEIATVNDKDIKIWSRTGELLTSFALASDDAGTRATSDFYPNGDQIPIHNGNNSLSDRWGLSKFGSSGPQDPWGYNYTKRSTDYRYELWTFHDSEVPKSYHFITLIDHKTDSEDLEWPLIPRFYNMYFAPDNSQILFLFEEGPPQLYTLDGTPGPLLEGGNSRVISAAFSPDSQYVVTAAADGVVRLWLRNGEVLGEFDRNGVAVNSVSFSPDGQYILMGLANGKLRVVPTPDRMIGYLQNETVIPPLTMEQRQLYGIE